jgi:hypothetical protein
MAGYYYARKAKFCEVLFSYIGPTGNRTRDLAYAVVFRMLWFYLSLMVRWRGVDL